MFKISLREVTVHHSLDEYNEIKDLFCSAFPENEQFPIWLLSISAIRKNVDFLAYYDEDSFCGISYTMNSEDLVFILYLAVNDKLRSKGYGSAILECLKKRFQNKTLVLNVEALESDADNYEQRLKRYEFYKRNGFVDTPYEIIDNGFNYMTIATDDSFSIEEYKTAIRRLSLGLYSPRVKEPDSVSSIDVGSAIKKLRTERAVSQEELAKHLGIPNQMVSRWEDGDAMPDITMLPKLATFFGTSIDTLFSINYDDELKRIDSILRRGSISDCNYSYAKRILDRILQNEPNNIEVIKRYAKVYLAKSNTDLFEAGKLLEKAMENSPNDEEILALYRLARGDSEN